MRRYRLVRLLTPMLLLIALLFGGAQEAQAATDTLQAGQSLSAGQALWSADGRYETVLQTDGNLVEYGPSGVVWASHTGFGNGGTLIMQADGNLVIYAPGGKPAWSSNTAPAHSPRLSIQTDGNLVVYDSSGRPMWSSLGGRTSLSGDSLYAGQSLASSQALWSADGRYDAIVQTDGNFVVYGPSGAEWSTRTGFGNGGTLVMQADGNLVLYAPSTGAAWSSNTAPSSNDRLVMQTDGNLVIYGASSALWSSRGGKTSSSGGSSSSGSTTIANDYPYDGALCSHTGVRDGSCANYDWGYKQLNGSWSLLSGRGFGYRNCTDYAAFKKGVTWSQINVNGDGNARAWKQGWINKGWATGSQARVGAIAWWAAASAGGGYGHVAYVIGVNQDGSAAIAEYNHDALGNFDTRPSVVPDAYLY